MTEFNQSTHRIPTMSVAAVAMAAALVGGVVGGVAAPRIEAVLRAEADAQAVRAAAAAAAEQAKWDAYGAQWLRHRQQESGVFAARDATVLKAAQEWEARYRQMYPSILTPTLPGEPTDDYFFRLSGPASGGVSSTLPGEPTDDYFFRLSGPASGGVSSTLPGEPTDDYFFRLAGAASGEGSP